MSYLSLDSAHSCTLCINGLVRQPQAGVDMLDVAHRVAIFNVRRAHPIHFLPHTRIQLFLTGNSREQNPSQVFRLSLAPGPLAPSAYLRRPEAEGSGPDIRLLFVHQEKRLLLSQTEILPCGHVSESEGLTPADMTPTPPGKNTSALKTEHGSGFLFLFFSFFMLYSYSINWPSG